MLTAQEKARILAKIRKDSYGITLEQMKQYFIKHQHAREIGDKKMMEKIEYYLTYINFHYECGLLVTGQIWATSWTTSVTMPMYLPE